MPYTEFIADNLRAASDIAFEYFGRVSGEVKGDDSNQVLTEADLAIGKHLVGAVQKSYPDHNVIDEEAGVIDKGSRYTWVIDPVEATSNFAAGDPNYGIMIGLLEDATPIAGGIMVPAYDRLYIAEKGSGATCNGHPIRVTEETDLLKTLVSVGIDSHRDDPERTRRECELVAGIVLGVRNIRNSGCEAVDPMYVAEGKYGGRVNLASKIWDNVAPQIICEEAGALWTDLAGEPLDYANPLERAEQDFAFCVASPALHKQLIAICKGYPLN